MSADMFLYAHLSVEFLLQQQTKGGLLEAINEEMLPKGLSQMWVWSMALKDRS